MHKLQLEATTYKTYARNIYISNYEDWMEGHLIYIEESIGHVLIGRLISEDKFIPTYELGCKYSPLVMTTNERWFSKDDEVYLISEEEKLLLLI